MANTETANNWTKIQQGVQDTERLIGQKQYNMAMVRARQTLEFMVNCLGEKACLVGGDLIDNIDELYQGRWISKATCENYHKIRMIGNKAIHEGNDNAYDANQAYHLLSQEVYTFANDYNGRRRSSGSAPRPSSGSRTGSGSRPSGSGSRQASGSRNTGSRQSGTSQNSRSQNRAASGSRRQTQRRRRGFDVYDLMKIGIAVLLVIFLIVLIRFIVTPKEDTSPTTTAPTISTEAPTLPPTTEAPTEPAETEPAVTYRTTSRLNVRSGPSTSSDVLATLELGVTVDYVQAYDDDWAIINYNGSEAYISSQYLESSEPAASPQS